MSKNIQKRKNQIKKLENKNPKNAFVIQKYNKIFTYSRHYMYL